MRLERERACDDHVLTAGYRATDYAEHLLALARYPRGCRVLATRAAVAMAQPSWIEKRLRVILAPDRNRQPVTKVAATISVLIFACLVLPIGIMHLAEAVENEALLQQIRETMRARPEVPEQTPTDVERKAMMELFTKRLENGLELK